MALLVANKDLINKGKKEFNILLNQQVFNDPLISDKDMEKVVADWVNFYLNYYQKHLTGEQEEQDLALQELQKELNTFSNHFLAKYRDFLKSYEPPNKAFFVA